MTIRLLDLQELSGKPNREVNGFGKETTTATIAVVRGNLGNGSMIMTITLQDLKLQRGKGKENLGAPKMNSHGISLLLTPALGVNRSGKKTRAITIVAA